MGAVMRRLLTIDCFGARLGATIDGGGGRPGLLFVTGGTQARIGSHRLFERLAAALAREGYPCLRFDRRGTGDSEGEDPGFRGSAPDIEAAAAAFRREVPGVKRVIGLGLCDGATALALHGAASDLQGLILINPWLVEAEANAPPPAAVRSHYRGRLADTQAWKRLLTGGVSIGKLLRGLKASASVKSSSLAAEVAASLRDGSVPTAVILAEGDATAIAAAAELKRPCFNGLPLDVKSVSSDSHTFARPGDAEALRAACLAAVRRVEGPARP